MNKAEDPDETKIIDWDNSSGEQYANICLTISTLHGIIHTACFLCEVIV